MLALLSIPLTWLVGTAFGYFVHKALHQRWAGRFYKSHLIHHVKLYPIYDFQSDKYRDAGKDNTTWVFLTASLPLGVVPIILYLTGLIGLFVMFVIFSQMCLIGFINSYIHDSFHITNHWLSKVPLFNKFYNKLIEEHYIHHQNVQKNFGIFSFSWDKLLGTYQKKKA